MDEKLLILLGLGSIIYLATANSDDNECDSDNDNDNENENDNNYDNKYDYFQESHTRRSPRPTRAPTQQAYQPPVVTYTQNEKFENEIDESPLYFGNMVQENYIPSDYETMRTYNDNDTGMEIPVYDEKTGNVLPIGDMTDMAAGEDNKYIYDRTIGSIGFTSTKIGGRRRGQADYIRGDLAIVPDRGSWFQVSADVTNTLVDGALNVTNGIGSGNNYEPEPEPEPTSAPTTSGRQNAMRQNAILQSSVKPTRYCDTAKLSPIELEKCLRDDLYTKQSEGGNVSMKDLKKAFSLGLQI